MDYRRFCGLYRTYRKYRSSSRTEIAILYSIQNMLPDAGLLLVSVTKFMNIFYLDGDRPDSLELVQ